MQSGAGWVDVMLCLMRSELGSCLDAMEVYLVESSEARSTTLIISSVLENGVSIHGLKIGESIRRYIRLALDLCQVSPTLTSARRGFKQNTALWTRDCLHQLLLRLHSMFRERSKLVVSALSVWAAVENLV